MENVQKTPIPDKEINLVNNDITLIKIFESSFGKSGYKGINLEIQKILEEDPIISLGENKGQIFNTESIENKEKISQWFNIANPAKYKQISINSSKFEKLFAKFEHKKLLKAKKSSFLQAAQDILSKIKHQTTKFFNIGSQIKRKEKSCRYFFHKNPTIRKNWVKMLSIIRNGFMSPEPIFSEAKKIEKLQKSYEILDYDILGNLMVCLYKNGAAFIYDFEKASIF